MKERVIGILTITTVIAVISLIYLTGDGLTGIEDRIEARQSVTVEEASIQSDFIYYFHTTYLSLLFHLLVLNLM